MAFGFQNIAKIPELRKRLLYTLAMVAVFRIGVVVTTPGVNGAVMGKITAQSSGLLGMFNMFSGGALEQLSIFALGIMPYVSASIILQLLTVVIPALDRLNKEGEQGRRKLDQYTRYGTVALSLFQAFGIAKMLEGFSSSESGAGIVNHPGLGFQLMTIITLTTGTAFLMWIGEQITERGVSNGISLLFFRASSPASPSRSAITSPRTRATSSL